MEELIIKLKTLSIEMLQALKNEEDVEVYLERRQGILDEIERMNFPKQALKEVIIKNDLKSIDKEVNLAFQERKDKIKEELKNLKTNKQANSAYITSNVSSIYQRRA